MALVITALTMGIFSHQAHAGHHENMSAFWTDQLAHGVMIQPAPFRAAERAVRSGGGYVIDKVQEGYQRGSDVVSDASRYIGTNPTGWAHNWCAEFVNRVLRRQGFRTSGSAMAMSFNRYGPHLQTPVPGAIAVLPHHVGFVESVTARGDVVLVSGNSARCSAGAGRCTSRKLYSRLAFVSFVMPQPVQTASLTVDQH